MNGGEPGDCVVFFSTSGRVGKSTMACYLWSYWVQQGKQPILVDGDLAGATVSRRLREEARGPAPPTRVKKVMGARGPLTAADFCRDGLEADPIEPKLCRKPAAVAYYVPAAQYVVEGRGASVEALNKAVEKAWAPSAAARGAERKRGKGKEAEPEGAEPTNVKAALERLFLQPGFLRALRELPGEEERWRENLKEAARLQNGLVGDDRIQRRFWEAVFRLAKLRPAIVDTPPMGASGVASTEEWEDLRALARENGVRLMRIFVDSDYHTSPPPYVAFLREEIANDPEGSMTVVNFAMTPKDQLTTIGGVRVVVPFHDEPTFGKEYRLDVVAAVWIRIIGEWYRKEDGPEGNQTTIGNALGKAAGITAEETEVNRLGKVGVAAKELPPDPEARGKQLADAIAVQQGGDPGGDE